MRAAQRVRLAKGDGPPAFAPVTEVGPFHFGFKCDTDCEAAADGARARWNQSLP
jgi:hypothetical protein